MKKRSLLLSLAVTSLAMVSLSGCSLDNSLVVWVGTESVEFYRSVIKEYKAANPDFNLSVSVIGADTGSAAGQMVSDNTACGDIVTVAHDNIGKLSQLSYIAPITDESLIEQINADNPSAFISVIKNYLGADRESENADNNQYYFGVPYISQALFLYYDTRYVSDTQADSFEGLVQAAKQYDADHSVSGTKGVTLTGKDGYNFSFSLLARNLTNGNTSTLRLYENGVTNDSYVQSNEEIAILRHMQALYEEPTGIQLNVSTPWATQITNHSAISVIGGAWHYNAFKAAVTDESGVAHMGCKIIPTFTLTADDVAGIEAVTIPNDSNLGGGIAGTVDPAPVAGTVFRGGSYVDCKCFVINMAAISGNVERYYEICNLLKFLSSKDIQNRSFLEALNVPAYAGSEAYIESVEDQIDHAAYLMAKAQTGMATYGIPQPFISGKLNGNYYSKQAPENYLDGIMKTAGSCLTVRDIRELLFRMEYTWKHGKGPGTIPATLPADSSTRQ